MIDQMIATKIDKAINTINLDEVLIHPPKAEVSMSRALRVQETVKKFLHTLALKGVAALSVEGHGDMISRIKDEIRGSRHYYWSTEEGSNGLSIFVCREV